MSMLQCLECEQGVINASQVVIRDDDHFQVEPCHQVDHDVVVIERYQAPTCAFDDQSVFCFRALKAIESYMNTVYERGNMWSRWCIKQEPLGRENCFLICDQIALIISIARTNQH